MRYQHKLSGLIYEATSFDVITTTLQLGDIERVVTSEHLENFFTKVDDQAQSPQGVTIEEEVKLESKGGVKMSKKEEKVKEVKPTSKGVSLKEMCEEVGISTRKARAILRKEDIPKPGRQWVWDDPKVAEVTKSILAEEKQ